MSRQSHARVQRMTVQAETLIFIQIFMHCFPQKKRLLHCFQELLFVWDSVLSNDGAQDASPMKAGGGARIAKVCHVGAWL